MTTHNPTVYVRADEQMQWSPLCLMLMESKEEPDQVSLLIRVPALVKKQPGLFIPSITHIPFHFLPKSRAIKKELNFIPELFLPPSEATKLIHLITKNPQVLSAIEEKLYILKKRGEIESSVLDMFISYKKRLQKEKIGQFTISTQSEDVFLVEQHGEIISDIGLFTLTGRGGYFNFTTTVAIIYGNIAQTFQVECKMYIFLDQEALGYYFEFYLNQQSILHQKIYEVLADMLMENDQFLEKTLTVLETCTHDQPSVVELIEKFRDAL